MTVKIEVECPECGEMIKVEKGTIDDFIWFKEEVTCEECHTEFVVGFEMGKG